MSEPILDPPDAGTCPKRLWVQLTLSDDELVGRDGAVPRGLGFHLSRCDRCRAYADRLASTSRALEGLAGIEPADGLLDAATHQALGALRDGARLTGRVDVPDEAPWQPAATDIGRWRGVAAAATAASVLVAVSLWGLSGYDARPLTHSPEAWTGQSVLTTKPGGRPARDAVPHANQRTATAPQRTTNAENYAAPAAAAELDPIERDAPRTRLATRLTRPIRRHRSRVEDARSEDPGAVQLAFPLPNLSGRNLDLPRLFDKATTLLSTPPSQDER